MALDVDERQPLTVLRDMASRQPKEPAWAVCR